MFSRIKNTVAALVRPPRAAERAPSQSCVMASILNDSYVPYYAVLLGTLRKHNPWLTCPRLVYYSQTYSPLSETSRSWLRAQFDDVHFIEVDEKRYAHMLGKTPKSLVPSLFTLECFRVNECDTLVYIDADMLCLGSVDELFHTSVDFGICPPGPNRMQKASYAGQFRRNVGFNAGMLVLGRRYRTPEVYADLLKGKGGPVADQNILNDYYRYIPIYCFHHRLNYHAQFHWDKYGAEDDVRLLHYAGAKPLEAPELPRMKPWFAAARELLREHPEWADEIRLPAENVEHGGLNS